VIDVACVLVGTFFRRPSLICAGWLEIKGIRGLSQLSAAKCGT